MQWNDRSVFLMAKTDSGESQRIWNSVQSWPQTIGSWVVTGDWDVAAWVDAGSWDQMYDLAAKLRHTKGVVASSSHWVHKGWKNSGWWWDYPAGAWVWWRDQHLNGAWKTTQKWKWAVSSVSVPGDWDWVTWVGGKNWDDAWKNVLEFQRPGWSTMTMVPVKSWWNKSWSKRWWEGNGSAERSN